MIVQRLPGKQRREPAEADAQSLRKVVR